MNRDADPTATPVCDELRASGYWNSDWDAAAKLDPIWTERFVAMGMHSLKAGVLDPKVIEFICIAVDASCTHLYASGTQRHIRKALALGATREQITAVLQLVSVLGIHSMSLGGPLLIEELERARNEPDATDTGDADERAVA
ncbi:Carboxymuconolactone decarboxylase (plasmid) [Cupriavidus taiwanensis]|uniref:Carboxymuconolactone decarboxylase n=1 Tax=Cupriavidus taiwanensis TaxID=164546 RepID=A0A375ILA2_9BURK|nr:carboxymuconolactone decarboxylase family protein [Cupriavidus taiwanensis]SPK70053.1 Carboxymuconolactone decarboxylase [Cupriavidus taiwanensis]SPK74860.1 Carboxymuconolactone decarboxylase [Cupriavidus taiwanensis]